MIEQDTIRLLRECDAGIKMGVSAIDEVLDNVRAPAYRRCLSECKTAHEQLDRELQSALDRFSDRGKDPNPMARSMSWLKTNAMLSVKPTDATVADLITDGCNMGVKSLSKYLNEYKAADEASKNITKRLIHLEEKLAVDSRPFL